MAAATAEVGDRARRGLVEKMTVLPMAPGLYSVTTQSGSEYTVDLRDGVCDCPDHRYREARCKHLWRAAYATETVDPPAAVDPDDVDPLLGRHCSPPGDGR